MLTATKVAGVSPAQLRLWRLQRVHGREPFQTICTIQIAGDLDRARLRQAIEAVVSRHESLRSTLTLTSSGVQEAVGSEPRFVYRDAAAPTGGADLQPGPDAPSLHVDVARTGDRRHEVTLAVPATWADLQSIVTVVDDLVALYDHGRCDGEAPLQYREVREVLREIADDAEGRSHWRHCGLDDLESSRLRSAPSADPARFRVARMRLPGDSDVMTRAARLGGGDATVVVVAAWALWLWRIARVQTVGWGFSGRDFEQVLGTVGLLARYLPLHHACERGDAFAAVVKRIQGWHDEARQWQESYEWERAGGTVGMDGAPGHFPYCVDVVELPRPWRAKEATFTVTDATACIDRFELRLQCVRHAERWETVFEWDPQFHATDAVERLAAGYHALLRAAVDAPDTPVTLLPVMGAAERETVEFAFNATTTPQPPRGLLHEHIAAQAATTPTAPSVRYESTQITYAELDARANRLAAVLRQRGVGPDVLVGIFLDRSIDLIVALLATLKAGGAYVPLPVDFPRERLAFMLDDVQPAVVLTEERLTTLLPLTAPVLCLDATTPDTSAGDVPPRDAAPGVGLDPRNAIYALYTSGSTGQPKGAVNTHDALVNRMIWMQRAFGLTAADRVLQKTPYSFDVSGWEFFWPLMTGACLVVAPPESHKDPDALVRLIVGERITVVHFVPSMLDAFLMVDEVANCVSLRAVICSGEALSIETQRRFFERLPNAELHNLYGPTEAAIDVTWHACDRLENLPRVPIGRPIDNTQIYVVDDDLQVTPIGIEGELCIAGVNLARGYLRRPSLTARAFVPNPFGPPSSRLYRTGDRARYRPDGRLEYLGRRDHQIKIRGARIELQEIEATLAQHPSVQQCVVIVAGDSERHRHLVAGVVASGAAECSPRDLRDFLRDRLPEPMIPARIVGLPALPLSPNGKIDRKAVAALCASAQRSPDCQADPRTPIEQALADVWRDVLAVPTVSIHDGFFDVGGHSLLAPQAIAKVHRVLGVELALCHLMSRTTIADLAGQVEVGLRAGHGLAEPIIPTSAADAASASPAAPLRGAAAVATTALHERVAAEFLITGALDPVAFERAYQRLVRRQEIFRTRIAGSSSGGHGEAAPPRLIDLTAVSRDEIEAESQRAVEGECWRSLDPDRDAPVWLTLIRRNEQEHLLLLVAVRAACDQMSLGVLLHDLARLYGASRAGDADDGLPPVPLRYRDYIAWQRALVDKGQLSSALTSWRGRMHGAPEPLRLSSTTASRPSALRASWQRQVLPSQLTELVKSVAAREGTTAFAPCCVAFQRLMAEEFDTPDVVVGMRLLGRFPADQTRLIVGPFSKNLPFRTTFSPDSTFKSLMADVRDAALDLYALHAAPWGGIADASYPGKPAHTAVPSIVFAFEDDAGPPPSLEGLTLDRLIIDCGPADCELLLAVALSREKMALRLGFEPSLCTHERARTLVERLVALLWSGAVDVDRRYTPMRHASERSSSRTH